MPNGKGNAKGQTKPKREPSVSAAKLRRIERQAEATARNAARRTPDGRPVLTPGEARKAARKAARDRQARELATADRQARTAARSLSQRLGQGRAWRAADGTRALLGAPVAATLPTDTDRYENADDVARDESAANLLVEIFVDPERSAVEFQFADARDAMDQMFADFLERPAFDE